MKKGWFCFVLAALLLPMRSATAQEPITAAIKAGVTKVIKAIDLQVQRQQNEVIWLQNAHKAVENAMAELQLSEIHDWVEKQRLLYQDYYAELHEVKQAVADYQRIQAIARRQAQLLEAYRQAWRLLQQDARFRPDELDYMARVYGGMLAQSTRHTELLVLATQAQAAQLGDAARLELINAVAEEIDTIYRDLVLFNRQNILLSLQRARTQQEVAAIRQLYGLP